MSKIISISQQDDSIIEGIKNFDDNASVLLYNKHKENCLKFMYSRYYDEEAVRDIYQDAVIVFIENVRNKNLKLENASIQTYLNSICFNQIKVRLYNKRKPILVGDDFDNYNDYNENIKDWFDESNDVKSERIKIIQEELLIMEIKGPQCFELLKKFFFENRTMDKIAELMSYTNADNAKSQKWKCQERLKKQVFNRLQQC